MNSALPAIRAIEIVPVKEGDEQLFCLYDPLGYVDEQIVLSPAALLIASSLDGVRDIGAIQKELAAHLNGMVVKPEIIANVVNYLDENGFLLSERFFSIRDAVEARYQLERDRPPFHAGKAYPANPDELRALIDSYFLLEGGPGPLSDISVPQNGSPALCVIAPHIDFTRGAVAYAHSYASLYRRKKPETVLLFGVAHNCVPPPFILSRKNFATPFGVLETNQRVVNILEEACDWNPLEYEFVQRTEHSIEFQAVMLSYLYGESVRIVPVLCSPFSEGHAEKNPARIPKVQRFLEASQQLLREHSDTITVIAGADLAHVGLQFGDDFEIDDDIIEAVARRDREDLGQLVHQPAESFYASVLSDNNSRRVCGLGCIYAAMKVVEPLAKSQQLLHYGYAPDPMGGIVSFAGMHIDR